MRRRGQKQKQKRAATFDGTDFFVNNVNRTRPTPLRESDEADRGDCLPSLVRLAATVAVETQCRIFKDNVILADVISRELGWRVASVPHVPSSSLSCFFAKGASPL